MYSFGTDFSKSGIWNEICIDVYSDEKIFDHSQNEHLKTVDTLLNKEVANGP